VSGTAVDKAGNTETATVRVSIDRTPPSVVASRSPQPNANGWNNTPVVVTFSASDALSGVATNGISTPVTLSNDGPGQTANGTAVDGAGNVGTDTESGIHVDRTKPKIPVPSSAAPGAH